MKTKFGQYLSIFGADWGTEDDEIGFPSPGDSGRHNAPCSRMLQSARQEGLHRFAEMARTGQGDTGQRFQSTQWYQVSFSLVSCGGIHDC
jgi:hypothetical protein